MAETLALINENESPAGGWFFLEARTGKTFIDFSKDKLIERLHDHQLANRLSMATAEDVEQATFHRLVDTHPHTVRVKDWGGRTLSQYWQGINGLATIVKFERTGRPVRVSENLARSRQEICVKCPFNVKAQTLDLPSDTIMQKLSGGRALVEGVHSCAKCSCPIAAKSQFTIELLRDAGDAPEGFPDFCWVHNELK
jgi:hypothetical protein